MQLTLYKVASFNLIGANIMLKKLLTSVSVLACISLAAGCNETAIDNSQYRSSEMENQLTLIDFDNVEEQGWIKSERIEAVSIVNSKSDGRALQLSFSSQVNTDNVPIVPNRPWDLTSYPDHNVAFDVENLTNGSLQFYVALEDSAGNREQRSLSVPANYKGTVFFPITGPEARNIIGLWGIPPVWDTDDMQMDWRSKKKDALNPNEIAKFEFFVVGLMEDKSMTVDNIRLRPNPKRDGTWLTAISDRFGQNAKADFPLKISSEEELRKIALAELKALAADEGIADRSRFGGYKDGPKLDATGFFRVEKVDGKWWMVDPEGYLFFSHGPANVRMANMTTLTGVDFKDDSVRFVSSDEVTPEDSIGLVSVSDEVRATRFVTNEMRHNMFEWLPSYDDPLADHYSYRRSTHVGPIAHGETYSFYRANLERRYGETSPESYLRKWEEVTLDRMKAWGFTSFGNWVDPAFYPNEQVPYFANGWIIGDFKTLQPLNARWSAMPDFYDPVFRERAVATISVIAEEVKASPWCIGIFIDNEKAWGELEGSVEARYGVITDALSKDAAKSPAKKAFTDHLKAQYGSIEKLNTAWETDIADWADFEDGVTFETYSDQHAEDLSKMLEMLGEQYFAVVTDVLKEYLPDHLYMGARMANWGMPPEIIKASVKYSDVLSFNIYEDGVQPKHWAFLEEVDLPTVIGEFHIGTTKSSGLYSPGIVSAYDEADRVEAYKTYMQSVVDNPYFVGAHWFQYMDEPLTGRTYDGENANIGFVNVADIPYPELIEAAKEFNTNLYPSRYGK